MPIASATRTHYEILGVLKSASPDDIKKAYKKKALETHPDKLEPNASIAEQQLAVNQFHRVHEAFEVLNDPEKRKEYDSSLKDDVNLIAISAEARRRIEARRNWAEQQRLKLQQHMVELKAKAEREKEEERLRKEREEKGAQLVQEMLQEMYNLNPEFVKRREAALQRKLERESAEALKRSSSRTFQT